VRRAPAGPLAARRYVLAHEEETPMTSAARFLPWCAAVLLLAPVLRADSDAQRHTLAGLKSLHVQFTLRGDDLQDFGLDEVTLRPEIEAKLAAAGIVLVDAEASRSVPGVPWLFVEVSTMKADDSKGYAWLLHLDLQQRVCLERDPKVCESAATWEAWRFGSVGRHRVKTLHEDVIDLTGQFVGAWQTANAVR
jgi:hypothetical protein